MPVSMPGLGQQWELSRLAAATDKLRDTHRSLLAERDALFASLQQRAFNGEL